MEKLEACVMGQLPETPKLRLPSRGAVAANPERELSFGGQAVGMNFNPSQDLDVYEIKRRIAGLIDGLHNLRFRSSSGEVARMAGIAITDLQTAQMWAVKAVTWVGD